MHAQVKRDCFASLAMTSSDLSRILSQMLHQLPRERRQRREIAHADGEVAQRPGIGEIDHLDRHALGGAPRRGGGHDADPHIALDQAADRVEAAQLHAQPQRPSDPLGLAGEEALQRARAVEPDEVMVEHLGEADLCAPRQRMLARHHQHEAVAAERIGGEPPGVHGAGHDADVADALGDEPDDLVGEPLLEVDAHVGMRREERAQRLGEEFRERIGVGEHLDLAGEPARVSGQVLAQPLGLPQDRARMGEQRAAGVHHVAKQAEIGEVETHGILRIWRSQATQKTDCVRATPARYFVLDEACVKCGPVLRLPAILAGLHCGSSAHSLGTLPAFVGSASTGQGSARARPWEYQMPKAPAQRPLSPHLQIYRPMLSMMMSIAHRLTGMALYAGTLLLAWWLLAAAAGQNAYNTFQAFAGSWIGQLILFGFTWAMIHHMLGGIRHFIWDLGYGFGPEEREWLVRATLIGSIGLTVLLWVVFVMGGL